MANPVISDYHMHTPLCGHARGKPKAYCARAVDIGLKEIGFSDHAPFVHKVDPRITMARQQLPDYHRMIMSAREAFEDKLKVKLALEADFIPGYEMKTLEIINGHPYDYIIGSVHFIKDWGFDSPDERAKWEEADINAVYRDYFELLRKSALSGMFDIIGHADLVKKFGHRPSEDMTDEIKKNAEVFRETGMAVEINTAGLRKPAGEIYPALEHLKTYREAGIPLTFGSDAHAPEEVGQDFDKGVELARAAGFKEYVLFANREIERVVKI